MFDSFGYESQIITYDDKLYAEELTEDVLKKRCSGLAVRLVSEFDSRRTGAYQPASAASRCFATDACENAATVRYFICVTGTKTIPLIATKKCAPFCTIPQSTLNLPRITQTSDIDLTQDTGTHNQKMTVEYNNPIFIGDNGIDIPFITYSIVPQTYGKRDMDAIDANTAAIEAVTAL